MILARGARCGPACYRDATTSPIVRIERHPRAAIFRSSFRGAICLIRELQRLVTDVHDQVKAPQQRRNQIRLAGNVSADPNDHAIGNGPQSAKVHISVTGN